VVRDTPAGHRVLHLQQGDQKGPQDPQLGRGPRRGHRAGPGFLQRDMEQLGDGTHRTVGLLDDAGTHGPADIRGVEYRDTLHVLDTGHHLLLLPLRKSGQKDTGDQREMGGGYRLHRILRVHRVRAEFRGPADLGVPLLEPVLRRGVAHRPIWVFHILRRGGHPALHEETKEQDRVRERDLRRAHRDECDRGLLRLGVLIVNGGAALAR